MSSIKYPCVTIGLPVFNGEKYLRATLESILSQTYSDFELIICDNASTDTTPFICRDYLARDKRIRYFRNAKNIGGPANFNRVFNLSSSKYFKWAAYDDIHDSTFLKKCVDILDSNPSINLCHSKTGRIDENGKLIGQYDFNPKNDWSKLKNQFGDIIFFNNDAWVSLFGLIRVSSLKKTRLFKYHISADRTLLSEISLEGRIYSIPELLFYRREHNEAYTNKNFKSSYEKLNWWNPNKKQSRFILIYWTVLLEYFRVVKHMHLKWSDQVFCYLMIFKWVIKEGWILLCADLARNFLIYKPVSTFLNRFFNFFWKIGGIK